MSKFQSKVRVFGIRILNRRSRVQVRHRFNLLLCYLQMFNNYVFQNYSNYLEIYHWIRLLVFSRGILVFLRTSYEAHHLGKIVIKTKLSFINEQNNPIN